MNRDPRSILCCALIVLSLSGCTSEAVPTPVPTPIATRTGPPVEHPAPQFTGPWAPELTTAYERAITDEQRRVLEDGLITPAEYEALRQSLVECMSAYGVVVTLEGDGGMSVDARDASVGDTEVIGAILPNCEAQTTSRLVTVFEQVSRNPERLDEATILVACMRSSHLVPDDYSVADFQRDIESGVAEQWNSAADRACWQDPLDILGAQTVTPE